MIDGTATVLTVLHLAYDGEWDVSGETSMFVASLALPF